MRVSIRRLVKGVLLGIGLITLLGFMRGYSLFFLTPTPTRNSHSDQALLAYNRALQDVIINPAVLVGPRDKEKDSPVLINDHDRSNDIEALHGRVPTEDSPQQKKALDAGKERGEEEEKEEEEIGNAAAQPKFPMPHPNEEGNGVRVQRREAGSGNDTSVVVEAYDWSVLRSQYFKGDNVPDDIISLKPPRFLKGYKNPCFYVLDPSGGDVVIHGDLKVRLKCWPYFHLIGVDKSGTTDLWFRLVRHPQVAKNSGVLGKETHWWSWRRFGFDIWVRNAPIRHLDWYLSHFDAPAKTIQDTVDNTRNHGDVPYHPVITGEGSPTVFWDFTGWDLIPQNRGRTPDKAVLTPGCIHRLTPGARFIVMFRNPVDRLYSEYLFLDRFRGRHNISADLFHEGVVRSIAMYTDCLKNNTTTYHCLYNKTLHMILPVRIMVGMYAVWLKQWFNVFPRRQVLILRNEDYADHLDTHMAQVFDFLGLSPLNATEMQNIVKQDRAFQRSKSERAVGDMLPATRQILTEFFQPYNQELADLLGDQKYLWKGLQ